MKILIGILLACELASSAYGQTKEMVWSCGSTTRNEVNPYRFEEWQIDGNHLRTGYLYLLIQRNDGKYLIASRSATKESGLEAPTPAITFVLDKRELTFKEAVSDYTDRNRDHWTGHCEWRAKWPRVIMDVPGSPLPAAHPRP